MSRRTTKNTFLLLNCKRTERRVRRGNAVIETLVRRYEPATVRRRDIERAIRHDKAHGCLWCHAPLFNQVYCYTGERIKYLEAKQRMVEQAVHECERHGIVVVP